MKPLKITIETIDAVLPQTQCGDCTYDGCLPYAQAIADGEANIDLCLPGGIDVLRKLAELTEQDPTPLEADLAQRAKPKTIAWIHEDQCIGCTKCIQACPVDAIFGSSKTMHTVIAEECTGCQLCVEPCPVDCIEMIATEDQSYRSDHARKRFQARQQRLVNEEKNKRNRFQQQTLANESNAAERRAKKRAAIAAAVARVQNK